MNESYENSEKLLDTTLNELPVTPLPVGFVSRVMSQIRSDIDIPRFHLELVDWVVPIGTAVSLLLLWFVMRLPQMTFIPLEMMTMWELPANWQTIILVIVAIEVYVALLIAIWLWTNQSPEN